MGLVGYSESMVDDCSRVMFCADLDVTQRAGVGYWLDLVGLFLQWVLFIAS